MPPIDITHDKIEFSKRVSFEKLTEKKVILRIAGKVYLVDGFASALVTKLYATGSIRRKQLLDFALHKQPKIKSLQTKIDSLLKTLASIKAIRIKNENRSKD